MTAVMIPTRDVWYDTSLTDEAGDYDAATPAIIVEPSGSTRQPYEVIDGHHRMAAAVVSGVTEIRAIVATSDETRRCRVFGGPSDAMTEAAWIDWMLD